MQATETVLSVIRATARNDRWRARYGETRSAGSGRGRRKRTRTAGTSPAAHFTLWEPEGETPSGHPTGDYRCRRGTVRLLGAQLAARTARSRPCVRVGARGGPAGTGSGAS
jgi:hypothetical protein